MTPLRGIILSSGAGQLTVQLECGNIVLIPQQQGLDIGEQCLIGIDIITLQVAQVFRIDPGRRDRDILALSEDIVEQEDYGDMQDTEELEILDSGPSEF